MIKKLTVPILSAALLFGASTLGASAMLNQAAPVAPAITAAQLFDEFTTQDPALITHLGIYIANNGNINERDNKGRTPLHLAAYLGHTDVVESLIQHGANVNAEDENGLTPLHLAIEKDNPDLVQKLLSAGADTNAEDSNLLSPLMWGTTSHGRNDLIELSLKNYPNYHNTDSSTPDAVAARGYIIELLHQAKRIRPSKLPLSLLFDGADPFI